MTILTMKDGFSNQLIGFMEGIQDSIWQPDIDSFKMEALKRIDELIPSERSILVLRDETASTPDFFRRNIHERNDTRYFEHYYSLDPFANVTESSKGLRLVSSLPNKKTVVTLEDIVQYTDFMSSEFYVDFLSRMDIHYELELYLMHKQQVRGYIGLFRSKRSTPFSDMDISLAKVLSPYVSVAIEAVELRRNNQVDRMVLDITTRYPSCGFLLFSMSGKLLHINEIAKHLFIDSGKIKGSGASVKTDDLPSDLRTKLSTVRKEILFKPPQDATAKTVLNIPGTIEHGSDRYTVVFSQVKSKLDSSEETMLLALMTTKNGNQTPLLRKNASIFGLTGRELEVIDLVCRGLNNSQIATELNISKLTVKTHIQNIFEKTHTNSRSSLVFNMLKN